MGIIRYKEAVFAVTPTYTSDLEVNLQALRKCKATTTLKSLDTNKL